MYLKAIHRDVLRDNLNRVRRLVAVDKANLDARNAAGATPLMLASLYGHVRVVRFLIQKKASVDVKDSKGRTAVHYARWGHYARSQSRLYRREFPLDTKADDLKNNREQIFNLLSDPWALQAMATERTTAKPIFFKDGKRLGIFKPIALVEYGRDIGNSTGAYISASGKMIEPEILAVSGWLSPSCPTPGVLDNGTYIQLVRQAINVLKCTALRAPRDKGDHGVWYACHSEKKLAVYWVLEQMRYALGFDDLARMKELKNVNLPDNRKRATIYLDHLACSDCAGFVDTIYKATGIEITLVRRPFVQRGSRGNKGPDNSFCPRCNCENCEKERQEKSPQYGLQDQVSSAAPVGQVPFEDGNASNSDDDLTRSDGRDSDVHAISSQEEIESSMPPEYERHQGRVGLVQYLATPRIRLIRDWDRFPDSCRKPPNGSPQPPGRGGLLASTRSRPCRPESRRQAYHTQEDQELGSPFVSSQLQHGGQQEDRLSQREQSSLPDPYSYQDGRSAHFGDEIEGVMPRHGPDTSRLFHRPASRVTSASRRRTPSANSDSVYESSLSHSQPARQKRNVHDAVRNLQLRARFTYTEQKPLPLLPLQVEARQKQPASANGPNLRRQVAHRKDTAFEPCRGRAGRRAGASRRPREEVLVANSTLRANLRYRQQQQQQQQEQQQRQQQDWGQRTAPTYDDDELDRMV